jgi:hypothetical protein
MKPRVVAESPQDGWHPARLIPTAGIKGIDEQERRATSAVLAVMHAVPEFGHALLKELGPPKSNAIRTFAEVRFKNGDGKTAIPDGAIVCERGKKSWTCLVEVKTSNAALRDEQVASYLDLARDNGFDAVLTISNQITAAADESPVSVDKRKLRKVGLWHLSWWRILTEAIVQSRYRGVSDPDQAWILRELIAYLDHEASGAGGFGDMGDAWVSVRKAAHDGTLRNGAESRDVVERWEQFSQYLCLGLSQDLGRRVTVHRPRKQTTAARLDELSKSLVADGLLEATLRVPDAVGDVVLRADLRSRQTLTSVTVAAPNEMRAKSRINWLLRQLGDAPESLRIDVAYPNARQTMSELLSVARDAPERLLYEADPRREPRSFTLTLARPMGQKRGKDEGSFVRTTREHVFSFYRDLVQDLKPWQARAPRLREASSDDNGDESGASSDPPSITSGARDPGDAQLPVA